MTIRNEAFAKMNEGRGAIRRGIILIPPSFDRFECAGAFGQLYEAGLDFGAEGFGVLFQAGFTATGTIIS